MGAEVRWTPELTDRAAAMYRKGISGTTIGRRMGLTRGQVIGRLHRVGVIGSDTIREDTKLPPPVPTPRSRDWDEYLFEPYAKRKARLARERHCG